ncbi:hypothetical protein P154DRAFT_559053 [Amniculicola lignicola CBS 123094]|uniref:DUF7730 domain-containing protein n=1 Tax=Amniculicola lignicola CBS 123094 TaxID=1392246 RepID=A0A6A5X2T7_9PLEO|nr:hypothetical protein P154DRAFT_559053 [Amniculicola lignicola CBS 123094]
MQRTPEMMEKYSLDKEQRKLDRLLWWRTTKAKSQTKIFPWRYSKKVHPQSQSPLFQNLPAEIRLQIYAAALGDPIKPLHTFLQGPKFSQLRAWRCERNVPAFPTHEPSGVNWVMSPHVCPIGMVPFWRAKHLGLLLSCRLIYSEAYELLYTENIFQFTGNLTVPIFLKATHPRNWKTLRRIHISTGFQFPLLRRREFPDEAQATWYQTCQALQRIPNLQILFIYMGISIPGELLNAYFHHDTVEESYLSVFRPLKDVKAVDFRIETNVVIPQSVSLLLGAVPFTMTLREGTSDRRFVGTGRWLRVG